MRRPLCLLALVLLAGLVAPGAAGADPSPSSAPARGKDPQQLLQEKKQAVASQIDVLKASDVELQVEVNRLGNLVKVQQDKVGAARLAYADIESKLGGLADEVDQAKRDADKARRRAADRAVDAYMHPGIESMAAVIEARDYDQAHRRRAFIGEVSRFDQDVLQGHLDAQAALAAREARLSDAKHQADDLRAQEEDALAEVQAAQARQVEMRKVLDARISDFQDEAKSLSAEEANMQALINQRASQAAKAPAPDADEVAAAPTTAKPAPTAAPTTAGAKAPAATAAPAPTTTKPTPAAPTTAKPAPSGTRLSWPLSGVLTSPFGIRWGVLHAGIDIGVNMGTPIHAAAAGTIIYCGVQGGYGNVVLIDHGNGLVTVYGHQDRTACPAGGRVSAGQVIGYSGNTGHSTGPHLHFEVRRFGTPVNPMQYLS